MTKFPDVEGFILVGGTSLRMGRDKARLEIAGETLLERTARLLESVTDSVTLVGPPESYADFRVPMIGDDFPGAGPLGGIATALRVARRPWCLVVACDLPYLTREWLEFLIRTALASKAQAVLPESARGIEPLCAMYAKSCEAAVRAAVANGVRKVTDGLAGLRVAHIPPREIAPFDLRGTLFKNMNTPEDYEEARAYFQAKSL